MITSVGCNASFGAQRPRPKNPGVGGYASDINRGKNKKRWHEELGGEGMNGAQGSTKTRH